MTENMNPCPCCGQMRPFPTEPGRWEYGYPYLLNEWKKCSVKISTGEEHREVPPGELLFYPDGREGPCEWPEYRAWKKL
jgi:hypothetical protein